jgi:hypothetical protein
MVCNQNSGCNCPSGTVFVGDDTWIWTGYCAPGELHALTRTTCLALISAHAGACVLNQLNMVSMLCLYFNISMLCLLYLQFCEMTVTYKRFSDYSLDYSTKPINDLYDVVVHARLSGSDQVMSGDCDLAKALLDTACPGQISQYVCEPRTTNCNTCESPQPFAACAVDRC